MPEKAAKASEERIERRRKRSPSADARRQDRDQRLALEAREALQRARAGETKQSVCRDVTPSDDEEAERRAWREASEELSVKRAEKRVRKEKRSKSEPSWGKYGVIKAHDIYAKTSEFRAWLVEERLLNPEQLSKARTKELFSSYMEDFNTGTLPHEKYYDLEAYERQMRSIRMGERSEITPNYDARRDEEAHTRMTKQSRNGKDLTKEQLLELQQLERDRLELRNMRRLGIAVPHDMGVRKEDKVVGSSIDWSTKSAWA